MFFFSHRFVHMIDRTIKLQFLPLVFDRLRCVAQVEYRNVVSRNLFGLGSPYDDIFGFDDRTVIVEC